MKGSKKMPHKGMKTGVHDTHGHSMQEIAQGFRNHGPVGQDDPQVTSSTPPGLEGKGGMGC